MTLAQALKALQDAGKIKSPWLPGMLGIVNRLPKGGSWTMRRLEDARWSWPSGAETTNHLVDREAVPDTSDPATVGCLLVLLREASGDHALYVASRGKMWVVASSRVWAAMPGDTVPDGTAEGEALACGLIALAVGGGK